MQLHGPIHVLITILLAGLSQARVCPQIEGLNLQQGEEFEGPAGALPNLDAWHIALGVKTNNEVQDYTDSTSNIQLSGGGTVQLVPRREGGRWTSGRIEWLRTITPAPGRITQVQAEIRLGDHPQGNKQGIWPAFWMMGDVVHHGTGWPLCGELDIMEQVNGIMVAHGAAHCGASDSGGPCNEPMGRGGSIAIPDNGWHTWALRWDLTSGNWWDQTITWLRDDQPFHSISGASIGDQGIWSTLAHSPYFVILNVAVGGSKFAAPFLFVLLHLANRCR